MGATVPSSMSPPSRHPRSAYDTSGADGRKGAFWIRMTDDHWWQPRPWLRDCKCRSQSSIVENHSHCPHAATLHPPRPSVNGNPLPAAISVLLDDEQVWLQPHLQSPNRVVPAQPFEHPQLGPHLPHQPASLELLRLAPTHLYQEGL